jgi:hypothetical protein
LEESVLIHLFAPRAPASARQPQLMTQIGSSRAETDSL